MPGYDFGDDYGKPLDKTAVEALHDAIIIIIPKVPKLANEVTKTVKTARK